MEKRESIYTLPFALLCLSSLLFSASFNMIIPELPNHLSKMGGGEHKGLIIALFTLTAGISRPFSGKLTDRWGRVPVMAVGSVVCLVCGFLYPVISSVSGFFLLRLIHGFSTGFKPTATSAYVADIIPQNRWGEALGMHGLCFSIGGAVGPAIGSYIALQYGINTMFYSSSLFALLSIVIVMKMRETLASRQRFAVGMLKINKQEIIEWRVLPAAVVTLLSYTAYGVILTLIPDWSEHLGIGNKGLFFTAYTLSSIAIRFFSGKVADRYGRIRVMFVGLTIVSLAVLVLGLGDSINDLIIGAIIYGIGTGILSPAVNAWTIDLSLPQHRGKAMATMYIALEAGIGGGAMLAGYTYQDHIPRIPTIFIVNSFIIMCAFFYVLYWNTKNKETR
ncbi:putative MFS family arabinose efflux permease [Sphingobacterium allocomposti]|uniref:Putative MFS family arabinose efflux permease n=1 Tax=Sphingobacterium allocomposti TaxID=415956 RepID=A0A5S5DCL8_9SPHI|nr:MFS transporter [Sphingobacterium composti Yoo et al. 2007 non Ten et al. 2007]TYP93118.1 putative MFS family arabinose efflux permease [Sphingobacterium composti Yoo et al. 2007 non Ten et al. 2007]